jgi:hypothetical protein
MTGCWSLARKFGQRQSTRTAQYACSQCCHKCCIDNLRASPIALYWLHPCAHGRATAWPCQPESIPNRIGLADERVRAPLPARPRPSLPLRRLYDVLWRSRGFLAFNFHARGIGGRSAALMGRSGTCDSGFIDRQGCEPSLYIIPTKQNIFTAPQTPYSASIRSSFSQAASCARPAAPDTVETTQGASVAT